MPHWGAAAKTKPAELLVALPPEDAKQRFKIGLQRRGLPDKPGIKTWVDTLGAYFEKNGRTPAPVPPTA